MSPTSLQIASAVQTLAAAGWAVLPPAAERVRLLSAATVAELLQVTQAKAREIIRECPGSVLLPGGDLRCRVVALEQYLDARPAGPVFRSESKSAA